MVAHKDFDTPETSPSENIHGMPVAVLVGDGEEDLVNVGYLGAKMKPTNSVLIGIWDLDQKERQRLAQSGVNVFTMRHVDELGIAATDYHLIDSQPDRAIA